MGEISTEFVKIYELKVSTAVAKEHKNQFTNELHINHNVTNRGVSDFVEGSLCMEKD